MTYTEELSALYSVETEQAVLSAIMTEPSSLRRFCGIVFNPAVFYDTRHRLIFESIKNLNNSGESVDVYTLVRQLKVSGNIDKCGGYEYVAETLHKVNSADHIESHAKILQGLFAKRLVYQISDKNSKLALKDETDPLELLERTQRQIDKISEELFPKETERSFNDKLNSLFFNSELIIPDPEPIISIHGGLISSPGNITYIKGPSKSGKSGILNAIISGAITNEGFCPDTCGITITPNKDKKLVLHIDTEQSKSNFYKAVRNILIRCEIKNPPSFLKSILVRELSVKERIKALQIALEKYATQFGGVHIVVIDGIADFVSSVNDEEECNEVVGLFEKLAIKYNCPIVTIVHLNPSSETKGRGHLDSQLERKSESVLIIKMDKDTKLSTLCCSYLRNAGNVPDIEFYFDTEKGFHVYKGNAPSKEDLKRTELRIEAELLFDQGKCKYIYSELVNEIKNNYAISDRSAKSKIALMKQKGIINNEPFKGGKYYLVKLVQS